MAGGLQQRKTVLGIKKETTEGVAVAPAAQTDYVALQTGFNMSPDFETLQNDELRASIGKAKPILGREKPSASFSHYLRHSGVEGQAPNFGLFLEALLGQTSSNATERTCTSGSTNASIKLGAGGSDFARGKAVLVKDPVNGFSIRPVLSVASNDLVPAFNLPGAPASGVKVGKCVNYAPANENHPSLSFWLYRANGGAVELMAGARVVSYELSINANQMINQAFNFEGSAYGFNPIIIGTANKLDFEDASGSAQSISVPAKMYKDPKDLADAINALVAALGLSETITCSYSNTTGKYTFVSNGAAFELQFATGANSANTIAPSLGFTATDKAGGLTYTSDSALSKAPAHTPVYDNADPLVAKNMEVLFGDAADATHFSCDEVRVSVSDAVADLEDIGVESGIEGKTVTERTATISIKARLKQHDVDKFYRYRTGQKIMTSVNFGQKAGGQWLPGKCGNVFNPDGTITKFMLGDKNGIITLEMEIEAYIDGQNTAGELYINFL